MELQGHKVEGLNELLDVLVLDEPGQGGACHHYAIAYPQYNDAGDGGPVGEVRTAISFQNGPIAEHGINGITNEALLAIVEHRLSGFQSGEFACEANQTALDGVRAALSALHRRTRERAARGVEGTNQK